MKWRRLRAAAMAMGVVGEEEREVKTAPPRAPLLETDFCAIRRLVRCAGPHAGWSGCTAGAAGLAAELRIWLEKLIFKDMNGL